MTLTMLAALLGHRQITLKPVIDLNDGAAADCYEIPDRIAERVHLAQPADVFPYAEGTSRRLDLDHTTPFDDTGPPGWTLTRRPRNRYWWTTPSGKAILVDRHGTHPLGRLDMTLAA